MTSYPCPYCRTPADLDNGCPGCGRDPDSDAAEVVRLDARIGVLNAQLAAARFAVETAENELRQVWQLRHAAAARVRAKVTAPGSPAAPALSATPPLSATPRPAQPVRETSTRAVQNTLFLLGGLLLGAAAIVFTAVAWSQFGIGGRAALLAAFTGAALAVPPLVLRRGLTGTAETFAAVGLLLVLLDGYAAWYVNVFGVADYSAYGYAGAVCAVTAAVAAGYEYLTGLTGPRFAALAVAQPVLPLLAAPLHPGAAGWSFTFAAVAVLNLAVVHLRRSALTPLGIAAYALGGCSIVVAAVAALSGLVIASTAAAAVPAGAGLVTAALVVLAAAVLARVVVLQSIAGGLLVVALGIAAGWSVALLPLDAAPVLVAAVLATLAGAVLGVPAAVRRGPWVGALVLLVLPSLAMLFEVAAASRRSLDAAQPFFGAGLGARVADADWRLPAELALLAAGLIVLLPAGWRRNGVVGGAALFVLTVPAGFGLPWWSAPALDLLVVALALAFAVRAAASTPAAAPPAAPVPAAAPPAAPVPAAAPTLLGSGAATAGSGVSASAGARDNALIPASLAWLVAIVAVLGAHAVSVGFGRPGVAAGTLACVVLLGLGAAVAAWSGPRRRDVGGVSLTVALLAVPAAAWTFTAALSFAPVTQSRVALAAAALVVVALRPIARRWSQYLPFALAAALLAVVSTPAWALASGDSAGVYAGIALLLVAATLPAGRAWAPLPTVPLGLILLAAVGPSLLTLFAAPYGWLGRVWSGRPSGVGIDPLALGRVTGADVAALALLAGGTAVGALLVRGRRAAIWAAAPVLAVTIPAALAAAGVRWPGVPAALLLVGLSGLLVVALRPPFGRAAAGAGGAGVVGGHGSGVAGTSGVQLGSASGLEGGGASTRGAGGAGTGGYGAAGAAGLVVVSVLAAFAGLAAALPTRASTLAALGAILVAGSVAGVAARDLPARLAGWLSAVGAALALAFTAARAFELPLHTAAFPVLGAAAGALAVGTLLIARRPAEARAVQAAAHAGALGALLLTVGEARFAAAVCTLWGLAIGVRALRRGESVVTRRVLVVAAAAVEVGGWWLLIAAERVSTLEAYTLPAAAVALLAGWLARRTRTGLTSWTGYGPALAAALLPTLASVLVGDGQPVRRLLLGLGALAVLLLGANARLQAPVVAGGAVLAAVALHELVLVWDLLPRWIPLAVAGLLLVLLAMTLERRRRDLARVRAALTRMS